MNATGFMDRTAGFVGATHPWNAETAADALRDVFGRGKAQTRHVLVPSAAMTEEIIVLAQLEFETMVVDPDSRAPSRVKATARQSKLHLDTIRDDFLNLPIALPGPVEIIVDRLYFHSLEPARRADWVHKVARMLPKDGYVAGLFLIGHRPDGPPYLITREELRRAMARHFEVKTLELLDWMGPDGDHAARGLFRRL
jgi:Thiopurine S-methyltransferase (TPMT)